MPYHHDAGNKTIYHVPEPTIFPRPDRKGNITGLQIWAQVQVWRADNFIDPETNDWHYKTLELRKGWYPGEITEEDALAKFAEESLPHFPEITKEEYHRLKREFIGDKRPGSQKDDEVSEE